MKFHVFSLAIVAFVAAATRAAAEKIHTAELSSTSVREKLTDQLFANYKKSSFPENTTVSLGLKLFRTSFDVEQDLMTSNVYLSYHWTDARLSWNAAESGVSVLRLPADSVWLPDFMLINGINHKTNCFPTNVVIFPSGGVVWVSPCQLQTFCNLTLSQHPYEEQNCSVEIGPWVFDERTMGLDFLGGEKKADINGYAGQKYKVTKNEAIKTQEVYDCCEEGYDSIVFKLGFTRQIEGAATCGKY